VAEKLMSVDDFLMKLEALIVLAKDDIAPDDIIEALEEHIEVVRQIKEEAEAEAEAPPPPENSAT
jgi:hypothetical protein